MKNPSTSDVETPRIEYRDPFTVAGICARYDYESVSRIPEQWQQFSKVMSKVSNPVGSGAYGVMLSVPGDSDAFDYVTGVATSSLESLSGEFSHADIPGGRYAVFQYRGPASGINAAWNNAWSNWLPQSGYEVVDPPVLFEQYGDDFDPTAASGIVDLWIPIEADVVLP